MINRIYTADHPIIAAQSIKKQYPDIYQKLRPHVYHTASGLDPRQDMSTAELRSHSTQVISSSGIMNDPIHRNNRSGLDEIAGVLLVAALLGGLSWFNDCCIK